MKKILMYIIVFIGFLFLMPILYFILAGIFENYHASSGQWILSFFLCVIGAFSIAIGNGFFNE